MHIYIYLRICTDLRWFHDISIKAAINDQTHKTPQLSGYLVHSVRLKQLLMEQKITFIVNTMGSCSHKYL